MRPLALVAAAAVAGLGAGCVTVPGAVADGGRDELRVETSDLAAAPTTALADFLAFARVGFESGGTRALDRLVQLFPELALEAALRADTATDAIGPSYDRVHGDGDPAARAALGAVLAGGDPGRGPFPPHAALRLALTGRDRLAALADAEHWQRAVAAAATAPDPGAWQRLLDLRPNAGSWPADAAFASELDAREQLVRWRLDRGEVRCAAIDALRAESRATGVQRLRLRLLRARALALAGGSGEALLLIGEVERQGDPVLRAEALALAATLHGQTGDADTARDCLERALAVEAEWPGRGRAWSDLAVAALRAGDEATGLRAFAAARAACTAAGDDAGLVRVLRNHATYLRATGDPTAAAALAAEADAKVRDAGLLTGIWSPR